MIGAIVGDMADLSAAAVSRMQEFGRYYPHAGYGGGVCMENLYKVAPFLKDFLGNSIESTGRGHFKFGNDGEWIHLDARFGNHFFIRSNMINEFIERFDKIPDGYIAQDVIDVAIDMPRGEK